MTDTVAVPTCACPGCGQLHSYVTGREGAKPEPGSHTVCVFCGALMTFADDMTLRRTTQAELNALPWSSRALLDRLQKTVRAAKIKPPEGKDQPTTGG